MCNFFSFISNPQKKQFLYCNWDIRLQINAGYLRTFDPDSHTSIASLNGYSANQEDKLNKYEYNPLTKELTVDQINNTIDDTKEAEAWVNALDFNMVCPLLIIKPIVNPLNLRPKKLTKKDISDVALWASVNAGAWENAWYHAKDSLGTSIVDSVWNTVRDSIGVDMGLRIWESIGRDSKGATINASVRAYVLSFFTAEYHVGFSALHRLWNRGFLPSFDGTSYWLHRGKEAEVVYKCNKFSV